MQELTGKGKHESHRNCMFDVESACLCRVLFVCVCVCVHVRKKVSYMYMYIIECNSQIFEKLITGHSETSRGNKLYGPRLPDSRGYSRSIYG